MKKLYFLYVLVFFMLGNIIAQQRWNPPKGTSWWWQLEDAQNLDIDRDVTAYDIDLFEGKQYNKISALKNNGKKVICYFSAGTFEPFRDDEDEFDTASFLNPVDGFEEERWLNIRSDLPYLNNIKTIMLNRIQFAKDCGCDAVEPDNLDAWDNTNGTVRASDQLTYNQWLADTAHDIGLSVGLKNDISQIPDLVDFFDFAVNEQCYAYGIECEEYVSTFLAQNKAVFNQEYYDDESPDDEGSVTRQEYEGEICTYFKDKEISSLWKEGFDLDGVGVIECHPMAVINPPGGGESSYVYILNKKTGKGFRPETVDNGSAIVQAPDNNLGNYIQWELVDTDNGCFRLKNKKTAKCIRPQHSDTNGDLILTASEEGDWTQWLKVATGDEFFNIKNRRTGISMRAKSYNVLPNSEDRQIEQGRPNWNGDWARFEFEAVDGNPSLSANIQILDNLEEKSIIYPNPVTQELHLTQIYPDSKIKIWNQQGGLLQESTGASHLNVGFTELPEFI